MSLPKVYLFATDHWARSAPLFVAVAEDGQLLARQVCAPEDARTLLHDAEWRRNAYRTKYPDGAYELVELIVGTYPPSAVEAAARSSWAPIPVED